MVHACIGFHAALWQTDTKAGMCLSRRDVVGCLMTKQQIVGIAIIHDVYTFSFIKEPVPILLNPQCRLSNAMFSARGTNSSLAPFGLFQDLNNLFDRKSINKSKYIYRFIT